MLTKADMFEELKRLLGDVFEARSRGESHPRLARAHGYVDGYMRALLETGVATQEELIRIVAAERTRSHGRAIAEVEAAAATADLLVM